jgi:DNA helicase HerA-like ATPase
MNNILSNLVEPFFADDRTAASSLFDGATVAHVFFAATVNTVPDLSSYPEFEHVDLLDQLQRVLEAQRLLLLGLAQHSIRPDVRRSIDIRYIFPGKQHLTVALIGKACASSTELAQSEAKRLWYDIARLFPRHFYRGGLIPVTDPEGLHTLLTPLHNEQHIVAIRKRVDLNHLLRLSGTHPVPYPLRWGISTMRDLCKTMLQMDQPCYVSSALAPTNLTDDERRALNSIASRLKRLSEGRERSRRMGMVSSLASGTRQSSLHNQSGQQNQETFLPDPQAQINGEIYEQYLRQLDHPLLWRCYIAGQNEIPSSVIGAWYAEIIGIQPHSFDTSEPQSANATHLPTEAPLTRQEHQRALYNLHWLEFDPHADEYAMQQEDGELSAAYQHLVRLPRLVDVQEASCVFKLPCLPYRDEIGLPTNSGAFVTLTQPAPAGQTITLGRRDDHSMHQIVLDDLTRHTLVAGTTGSGKTTTCLHMLEALLRTDQRVPFLVIEPVNAEHNDYRTLLNVTPDQSVHLFTVGDEHTAPFRLNPFVIAPGIGVREHISSLLQCFKAAIPMWEPLPRVFLKALNRTYARSGWAATQKAGGRNDPSFPTIYDFYVEISRVVENEIEHEGEIKSNILGATKLRIESLLEGSCGRTLATRQSFPAALWLEHPAILELRHIGDDEDKALMVAFILLTLREHCEQRPRVRGLQHVTLIEEAHRLLGQAPEGASSDVSTIKGQAAAAFASMLAETRKYGEGLIIAEQLPTRLVPDVIGNTNLKIMHRLVSKEDREVLGRSMRFHSFQEDHVATLKVGQAAVYSQEQEEAVLIEIEGQHWVEQRRNAPLNQAVAEWMNATYNAGAPEFLPFGGCALCPQRCAFRDQGETIAFDRSRGYERELLHFFANREKASDKIQVMRHIVEISRNQATKMSQGSNSATRDGIAYCAFLHLKGSSPHFHTCSIEWNTHFRAVQQED